MEKYLVGSTRFFKDMPDFHSKDVDYLILEENPKGYKWRRECSMRGICKFEYKKDTPANMVAKTLESNDALPLCKFIVPEVINAIGATIEDIKPLQILLPKLDKKHKYVEVIFNAYMSNNNFTLTDKQLTDAYKVYLEAREENNIKSH